MSLRIESARNLVVAQNEISGSRSHLYEMETDKHGNFIYTDCKSCSKEVRVPVKDEKEVYSLNEDIMEKAVVTEFIFNTKHYVLFV